jgi:type VI protein secretion system component VasF
MNHSTKKQHHEKTRKEHKHKMQTYARESAKRGRSRMPLWFLAAGIVAIAALVLFASFRW